MNKLVSELALGGVLLVAGIGCQGSTLIGSADAGCRPTFPQAGFFGPNILYPANDTFVAEPDLAGTDQYELVVQHQSTETVKVIMTSLSNQGIWYVGGPANDWKFTPYGGAPDGGASGGTQTFQAPNVTGEFEESIFFDRTGQARLDVYACDSTTPSVSKVISWSPPDGGVFVHDAGVTFDAAMVPLDGSSPTGVVGGRD
ncbi:MAG TPA: hypothetical protein VMT03_04345 [Polyangia bacterium]|nr:hypothetical protein [Polyangia bacterium]